MKLTSGTVVRIKSFAHVEYDGKMKGFGASPEDTPDAEREIFTMLVLGKEPMLLTKEQEELYAMNVRTQLNLLGWFSADQLEDYMKNNIGVVGEVFRKVLAEMGYAH